MGLAEELKMSRPFAVPEEEATLAILRTADVLHQRASAMLKQFDITAAQYNVLRILHGSPSGLPCSHISDRLIARDPDVTRLLDRMEARGWIKRKRCSNDRRVVIACITSTGFKLLGQVAPFVTAYHQRQFCGWGEKQLKQLTGLLEQVRKTEPQIEQEK